MTVQDLEGASGGSLAGTLMPGTEAQFGLADRVLGGFAVEVTADPFTTTQTVNVPQATDGLGEGLFPYVTQTPLALPAGTYVLALWAAPSKLGPYSRWVPASTPGLRGCEVVVEVDAGRDTYLTVQGMPTHSGASTPCSLG